MLFIIVASFIISADLCFFVVNTHSIVVDNHLYVVVVLLNAANLLLVVDEILFTSHMYLYPKKNFFRAKISTLFIFFFAQSPPQSRQSTRCSLLRHAIGGEVSIKIFISLGQGIATLLNERKEVGYHYAEWDASQFPSGVYYYRITNGAVTETKRMVLTK